MGQCYGAHAGSACGGEATGDGALWPAPHTCGGGSTTSRRAARRADELTGAARGGEPATQRHRRGREMRNSGARASEIGCRPLPAQRPADR